ncbi:hypothetical protein ACLI08_11975 [Flavobacterium sp. RNTU_13]|uniref:hypothetical protein n=1 Tax=Flavobacterium sp. RNTU_13 TaxID=3375145 RepID=UPI003988A017
MKKILLFMAAIAMASCSDDTPPTPTDDVTVVLPSRIVTTKPDGTQLTATYTYSGNRITTTTYSDGTSESYSYIDQYLTEKRIYQNGGLIEKDVFLYDAAGFAGRVKNYYNLANPSANYSVRSLYTYSGTTVSVTELKGDENSQTTPYRTLTLTMATNGNIVKYDDGTTVINYSYDYFNNPFKNLYAYGILILSDYKGGANNVTGTQTTTGGTNVTTFTSYTYNMDYPVTATTSTADGSQTVMQYTY